MYSLQEGRKEAITDMGDMATYHIKEFEKNTRALPDTIIMFRDGVSESVSGSFAVALFCFGIDSYCSLTVSNTPRSSSLNARLSLKPLRRSRRGTSPSLPVRRDPVTTLSHFSRAHVVCEFAVIICAKRHSMRFFAANPADNDRSGNLVTTTCLIQQCLQDY